MPKAVHGSAHLGRRTASARLITRAMGEIFDRIVNPQLPVRRRFVGAAQVTRETEEQPPAPEQLDMFTDYAALDARRKHQEAEIAREKCRLQAVLGIKQRFGKNAILRGMDFQEGATARERNDQIGGHKA